ncbi:Concanavalin A-like lectin/glucanases superfamily protein [Singulisphaera sp. GP187]|nr:Concanavalin A-like lectin/glucanases superfamily protein [Singulisphaera sp. GP187]
MRLPTLTMLGFAIAANWGLVPVARAGEPLNFDREVAPILARRCLDCHSGLDPKGGLDLSSRASAHRGGTSGEAFVPGKPDESLLWEQVADGTMPPKVKLSAAEKSTLRRWIAGGAEWGLDPIDTFRSTTEKRAGLDWWSLQPVVRPTPPAVIDSSWCQNPIDSFILHRLETERLTPQPPVDRRTLIRRLSFDLLGLPPTPEEVDTFMHESRTDAYERLVDRYLASPQYGVRWGRLWLDLARYGESNGFEHDEFRPDSWPYRDWVVNSLNRDTPYDEFARLQLAGDALRPNESQAVEATGFLVAGAFDSVGQSQQSAAMRKVVRQDELEDMVSTVGQTFLGLTIHCARCHDHKFDPIRQVDYYRIVASLAGVRHGVQDVAPRDSDVQTARRRIPELQRRVLAIEATSPTQLSSTTTNRSDSTPPTPIARWDFDQDEHDQVGKLTSALQGGAKLGRNGLKLHPPSSFASTVPLTVDLKAKTLEAWVRLDRLEQAGGGVIGVQTLDGRLFDTIVFAEREPRRWMAGSENYARTQSFRGSEEHEAVDRPIHLAIVYDENGTITAYREGKVYGTPYRSPKLTTFAAGQAQVVFGLRHGLPTRETTLGGQVLRARLYDRALTAEEVASSAHSQRDLSATAALEARLTPELRAERSRLLAELDSLWSLVETKVRKVYANTPRPPEPVHRLIRGDAAQPAELIAAGGLPSVTGPTADFGLAPDAIDRERRSRLAAWVTDSRNPLFTRVIVNRLWQGHFGSGLVETSSDFGFQGGQPSHPELLDWLAAELVSQGWSLKQVHRQIVTSATYRQSARLNPDAAKQDAANRLHWRKAPQRLEAEAVRDAMLAVAGVLNPQQGGPGYREFKVTSVNGAASTLYTPIEAVGPEFDRRTIYRTWARGGRSLFLDAFDCPDPSTTAPRRAVTITPLQALALLNNDLTLRLAERTGERLRNEAGENVERQVERAYQLAFGRAPDAAERERARQVVVSHGLPVLARAIFNSNEFLYID